MEEGKVEWRDDRWCNVAEKEASAQRSGSGRARAATRNPERERARLGRKRSLIDDHRCVATRKNVRKTRDSP